MRRFLAALIAVMIFSAVAIPVMAAETSCAPCVCEKIKVVKGPRGPVGPQGPQGPAGLAPEWVLWLAVASGVVALLALVLALVALTRPVAVPGPVVVNNLPPAVCPRPTAPTP